MVRRVRGREPDCASGCCAANVPAILRRNMVVAFPPRGFDMETLTPAEASRLAAFSAFQARELGYQAIQASKPDTLAYALTDSPLGHLLGLQNAAQWCWSRWWLAVQGTRSEMVEMGQWSTKQNECWESVCSEMDSQLQATKTQLHQTNGELENTQRATMGTRPA